MNLKRVDSTGSVLSQADISNTEALTLRQADNKYTRIPVQNMKM